MRPSFLDEFSNSNVDEEIERRRSLIKKWLVELGFTVNEYQDRSVAFGFGASLDGYRIGIYQSIGQPDVVILSARLDLKAYSGLFSNRRTGVRDSFLWELGFALLDTGLAFMRDGDPPVWVDLVASIYSDGLTKDRFAQEALKVQLAIRRVFWMLDREMKKPAPDWKATYIR